MRLVDIQDDARGAAAGVDGDLQIPDLRVENSGVEGDRAARIFDARLIVPQSLVIIIGRGERAVDRHVRRTAQGDVERIVDSAEAEALGGLQVDAEVAVRFPGGDHAGADPVRLGFVAKEDIAVRKNTARNEVAFFLEVVVASAAGQLELAEVVAGFAEQRRLIDIVGQIGVVGRVEREAAGHHRRDSAGEEAGESRGGVDECVIARRRKTLGIVARNVRVKTADQPLEWPVAR